MVKRADKSVEITEEGINQAFDEVIYYVNRLDLYPDDKLALVGKIEVRRVVELAKIRNDFKQSRKFKEYMRNYGR